MNNVTCDESGESARIRALFEATESRRKLMTRIFIANNGLSAVKFVKSMEDFSYQAFGKNLFEFYGMATAEDLEGGYEYCRKLTDFEIVDSGPSPANFGNVQLIVRVATQFQCECLWAGWGHASEDPRLPAALEKTSIVFLGPSFRSMWLLGNKISSIIMAEKLGVNLLPYCIDDSVRKAHLGTFSSIFAQQTGLGSIEKLALQPVQHSMLKNKCRTLKFPVLLKMSQTGGGRGICRIESEKELDSAIDNCSGGSFLVVECAENVRHIEVQIVSDASNNVLVLGGRDCTTQRRHQKVIETSVSVVCTSVMQKMERDAEKLAREARYTGLATVEFLFDMKSRKYYFLEVNTRIQVEHTVTEILFGVNLPAIQYLVGMGVSAGDIEKAFMIRTPKKYVMGIRLTAENPASNFDPVTGKIVVRHDPVPGETGYFSVYDGAIHEYSESQFGHIFVHASTRRECIAKCLRALSSIHVEYIETPIKLISKFIQTPEFVQDKISTSSLENFARNGGSSLGDLCAYTLNGVSRCKAEDTPRPPVSRHHSKAAGGAGRIDATHINFTNKDVDTLDYEKTEGLKGASCNSFINGSSGKEQKMAPYLVSAAIIAVDSLVCIARKKKTKISFLFDEKVHTFEAHLASPSHVMLETDVGISCVFFRLISPSKVILRQRASHIVKFHRSDATYYVIYDGQTYLSFTKFSSNSIRSPKSGKLVAIHRKNGDHVLKNDVIFEIESLKIRSPVLAPFEGTIAFEKRAGDRVVSQEPVCTIENASKTFEVFDGVPETFVDDGTLTLHSLEGFSVPQRVWHVPERAGDIEVFIGAFLRNGGSRVLCLKILETLKSLLSRSSVGVVLGCKLIKSLHQLVLRCDGASSPLYGCIEFCLDALENSIHSELLGLRPYLESSLTESPIRIHYMDRSASELREDAEVPGFLPRRSLFIHFASGEVSVEAHASVYLSEDFWPTLLSNIRLKVLKGEVALEKCVTLIINLHGDSGVSASELPPRVFGYLKSCDVENIVLVYQGQGVQYEASTIRGFLETKLVKDGALMWYRMNMRPVRGVDMQDVVFDKKRFVKERTLAKKNNTTYYRDFIEIVRMYFKSLEINCAFSEVYMCDALIGESCPSEADECKVTEGCAEDIHTYPSYVYSGKRYTLSLQPGSTAAIGVKGFVLEYDRRKVLMIFNDISHKHGSFSILEDVFFYLLTKYCRINKFPRVFIASNSGARVGICDELVGDVEAVFKDGKIEYLALKKDARFSDEASHEHADVQEERRDLSSAAVYASDKTLVQTVDGKKKILSIFGNTDSGPENLSFSALIAAETARAYKETFTVSYVTGISVGIGAYLAKLGERIIQKHDAPILLTGYKVLNRLLQEEIYKSNAQLGGFDVLGHNGVSHVEAHDDLHGVEEVFWWVNFYFSSRAMKQDTSLDSAATEERNVPYEHMLDVSEDSLNEREVLERVLDNGTFKEYQKHWAPNVIVGRGYVNGTALGIVCPEIESKTTTVPCEPYETGHSITWTKNVIFSETAEKISRAIEDFNHERVDLLIIANWKGFSGSTASMFKGIMKTGADIIKNLAEFRQKVFVYLPPHGELRGGTYVVFDKKINKNIRIIAHPTAGVGIIQPDGLGEIKMRNAKDKAFAEAFCMLHDNVYRMVRNGVVDGLAKTQSLKEYVTSYLGLG